MSPFPPVSSPDPGITVSSLKVNLNTTCRTFLVPDRDNLSEVQVEVVDLGDEDGSQSLVEGGPVHVNGGSHREHEPGDALVHAVVLFQALEGDGQGGRTGDRNTGHVSGAA